MSEPYDSDPKFKVGDLVRFRELSPPERYIFRPRDFPFGAVGLILSIEGDLYSFATNYESTNNYAPYPYPYYGDEYYWEYSLIYVVLAEGEKWWLFEEEIELFNKEDE